MAKDYEFEILYRLGKVNMVADALSLKSTGSSGRDMCMRISIDSPLLDLIRVDKKKELRRINGKSRGSWVRLIGFSPIVRDC